MAVKGIAPLSQRVPKKVMWRLIPLLIMIYVLAHLDRVNVSFAGLTMTDDLGFSAEVFGFGSGISFLVICCLKFLAT